MNLSLKSYAGYLRLVGISALTIACSKEPISSPTPTQLVKVSQKVYFPSQHLNQSIHSPLLYQGVTYYYSNRSETTYQYDELGRLREEKQLNPDFPAGGAELGNESKQYTYRGDTIICFSSLLGRYSFTLDKLVRDDPPTIYTYDSDGFLVRKQTPYVTLTRTIEAQNLVKEVSQEPTELTTSLYEYALDHLNMIDPLAAFKADKASRNLLIKSTITVYKPNSGQSSRVTKTYSYTFDERNRVSQQMVLQLNTVAGYEPILTVNRFTYSD